MQSPRRLLESRVDRLAHLVPQVDDDELRAELTKHLCVLCSGLLEVSCRDIIARYAKPRTDATVFRFVESRIGDLQSATIGNMHSLLSSFDPSRAETWLVGLTDEQRDSVDSIVNNRHQIAHGRSIGLSFDVLNRYRSAANQVVASIEAAFPGHKRA